MNAVAPFPWAALPRVARADAELIAALHRRLSDWRGLLASTTAALGARLELGAHSLGAGGAAEALRGLTVGWLAALEDASGELVGAVHLDSPVVQTLAARILAGHAGRAELRPLLVVEEEALTALLGFALSEAEVPLLARTAEPEALERLGAGPVGRALQHVRFDGASGWATLWLALDRLPDTLATGRSPHWRARLARSPLSAGCHLDLHLRLATFQAGYKALSELDRGDVLMPGAWLGLRAPARALLCLQGAPVAEVVLDWSNGIEFQLVDPQPPGAQTVSDTADALKRRTLQQLRSVVNERFEELEIVVGGVALPLGEILDLQPGRVFVLDVPLDAPAELLLDGRRIGRGELVDVGGRLGIRVTSIAR